MTTTSTPADPAAPAAHDPTPTPGGAAPTGTTPADTGFLASLRKLPNEDLHPEQSQPVLFGIGILAFCLLTMGQPFLRFGDNSNMAIVGVCAGLFGLMFNAIYLSKGRIRYGFAGLAVFFVAFGGITLIRNAFPMIDQSAVNDARCLAIQEDMLSARPRKANGPELFQALGCAPTGDDPRIFAPPTDREMRAGRPLPFGGYSTRHS